jgi:hypothetical protein
MEARDLVEVEADNRVAVPENGRSRASVTSQRDSFASSTASALRSTP